MRAELQAVAYRRLPLAQYPPRAHNSALALLARCILCPVPTDHSPLCALQVLLTPHIGWQRAESRQRLVDTVAENVAAFRRGTPRNVVS